MNKNFTTLDVTIVPEKCPSNEGVTGDYFKLTYGKGDKCVKRYNLLCDNKYKGKLYKTKCEIKPIVTFVQITDIHIIDATNPSRASFLAPFLPEEPLLADSFRGSEFATCQVAECMVRKINSVERGPHLGQMFSAVVNTGDNSDSEVINELQNHINLLDGQIVVPNPTGNKYVGVQDDIPGPAYPFYYHPDPHPPGMPNDMYKIDYGYPNYPDILDNACKPFCATGLNYPWFTANGNHDVTKLGNAPWGNNSYQMLTLFDQIATGKIPDLGSKLIEGMAPAQARKFLLALELQDTPAVLDVINNSLLREVPFSEKRFQFMPANFISAYFNTTEFPGPIGHGYSQRNILDNTLYYTFKLSSDVTGIVLDSCNPGGNLEDPSLAPNGSIGRIQLGFLEEELRKRHSNYYNDQNQIVYTNNKDELVVIFCHHSIETMNNIANNPTSIDNDPQRIDGQRFRAVLNRYPNVIALVNGHEHRNVITPYPDPTGKTQGFWQINTASHIDYPQQSRIIEIGDNQNGTLSIFCTMLDHLSPANAHRGYFPETNTNCSGNYSCCAKYSSSSCDTKSSSCDTKSSSCDTKSSSCDTKSSSCYTESSSCYTESSSCYTESSSCQESYSIAEMASISRELSYNDPFIVNQFDDAVYRTGTPEDRNVQLFIYNPLCRIPPRPKCDDDCSTD